MKLLLGWDLVALIQAAGYAGLFGIIFAESGLLVGFFLPGDSLLFTAGFLASRGYGNIWILIVGCFSAAVLGDSFGYAFGRRLGPRVFRREDSFFFHKDHLERARFFYEKYGGKTIILARFLPVVRTFAPILAGVGRMRYPTFLFYNVVGGLLWAVGMTWLGWWLGGTIPDIDRYLIPIILVIIFGSILPPALNILKSRERRREMAKLLKTGLRWRLILRKIIGVVLILFGIAALVIPLFPFGWVAFIGLELLGFRTIFHERLRGWWRRGK